MNESSVALFDEISNRLPVLRRLTASKVSEEQANVIIPLLDYIRKVSMIDTESEEANRMNQNILSNQDVVGDIFDILSQKVEFGVLVSLLFGYYFGQINFLVLFLIGII